MIKKISVLISIMICFSCQNKNIEKVDFEVVLKKVNKDSLMLDMTFSGPLNILWNGNILSHNYYNDEESNITLLDLKKLSFKRSQIVIENKSGDMRFFSNIPKGVEFWFDPHYRPMLPKKQINLKTGKSEKVTFKIPYSLEHFAIKKGTIDKEIRLHYIYVPDSLELNSDIGKTIITSNWITLLNV
jgi:hypothetical protein